MPWAADLTYHRAEEVWLAGTAGLLGREDPGGGDELIARGL